MLLAFLSTQLYLPGILAQLGWLLYVSVPFTDFVNPQRIFSYTVLSYLCGPNIQCIVLSLWTRPKLSVSLWSKCSVFSVVQLQMFYFSGSNCSIFSVDQVQMFYFLCGPNQLFYFPCGPNQLFYFPCGPNLMFCILHVDQSNVLFLFFVD